MWTEADRRRMLKDAHLRQLSRMPDGSILLVPVLRCTPPLRRLLKELGRSPNSVKFATPQNFRRFEGDRVPHFEISYEFWRTWGQPASTYDRVHEVVSFLMLCVQAGQSSRAA